MVPHLAEDAWQALPWEAPTTSVFQAGWFEPPQQWQSLPEAQLQAFRCLLLLRCPHPSSSPCSRVPACPDWLLGSSGEASTDCSGCDRRGSGNVASVVVAIKGHHCVV